MTNEHAKFVHEENVRHLKARLQMESDPETREMVETLLKEEMTRIANLPKRDNVA
jgi:hypothetical protein